MNNNISAFPFELAIKDDTDQQELFIKTVEQIMSENLQSKRAFGCRIENCHMHIGSKIHTNEFIEAELLFHNSYYNSHFAWLTKEYIRIKIYGKNVSSIILVGYETFGELYLLECVSMLKKIFECPVYYSVAEAKGSSIKIRSTVPEETNTLDKDAYYVFIVPISTTLTTHDKLMHEYQSYLMNKINSNKSITTDIRTTFDDENSTNLALIVIGSVDNNDYWEEEIKNIEDPETCKKRKLRYLKLLPNKQDLLTVLGKREVRYFARYSLNWESPKECDSCYPDRIGKDLTEETPAFEVSKEAIVPVLQIGIDDVPAPLKANEREKGIKYKSESENIKKVIDLSTYMYAKHVVRNGNHYQYYINSQDYIEHLTDESNRTNLDLWEENIKNDLFNKELEKDPTSIFYDFLVAPRHFSNAGFVHEVNTRVFNDAARVLYIDVNKEYRKNLVAKYSDFTAQVQKIAGSKQNYKIRFHYVDDMIITGNSFHRSKSLVHSIIGNINNNENSKKQVELFSSIIVLVDRNSEESRKNYISEIKRFYPYVYVSISSLRNQENSCVLCNVRKSFKILRREAAFRETSKKYKEYYKKYEVVDCLKLEPEKYADHSEQLLMIIGHILEERLTNKWCYEGNIKDGKRRRIDVNIGSVNVENKDEVLNIIEFYYKHVHEIIAEYSERDYSTQDVEIAMIKIISRPYFTNHIRRRQASFEFCIKKIAEYLDLPGDQLSTKIMHVKALINAMSDMNANYLFRRRNIDRFLDIKDLQDHYIRAIKKEICLSNDDNKSVLLEHSLVNGNENWLFEDLPERRSTEDNDNPIVHKEAWMALYFENNSVLKSSLIKARQLAAFEVNKYPYYLNSFVEIMRVNGIDDDKFTLLNNYIKAFSELYGTIKDKKGMNDIQYAAECMLNLLCCDSYHIYEPMYIFIKDRKQEAKGINRWDRYAILAMNKKASKIDFYSSSNLEKLDLLTNGICNNRTVISVMDTIFYFDHKENESDSGEVTVVNLYEENDVCLYLQLQLKNTFGDVISSQKSIKENALHLLLPLKILLSIRYEIAKYMRKSNVLSYLQGIKSEDITNALIIRKASKHQDLGINEGNIPHQIMFSIYSELKGINTADLDKYIRIANENFYIKDAKFPESFIESFGGIIGKYIQYLANEYVSTFYKEMVTLSTNDNKSEGGEYGLKVGMESLDRVLAYFKRMGFVENANDFQLKGVMYVPNRVNSVISHRLIGEQEIRITIHTDGFSKDRVIWTRKAGMGALTAYYYLLIISLSMNAGKHFRRNENPNCKCYVDVIVENEYLVIRNTIAETKLDKKEIDKINYQAKQKMMTPPWFFEDEAQSITLWTLHTFMELFQKNKRIIKNISNKNQQSAYEGDNSTDSDWINAKAYSVESIGKSYFEIRLRMIGYARTKRGVDDEKNNSI